MGKSLLNCLGRGIKRGVLIATAVASLGFAGCKLPEPNPVNYAPVANIQVAPNPILVDSPTYITLNGTDENGIEDIVEYKIGVDKNSNNQIDSDEEIRTQTYPITNFPVIFNANGEKTILGQVKDSGGETAIDGQIITVNPNGSGTRYNIIGNLQDNETNQNQIGELRVYINEIEDFSQRDNDGGGFSFSVPQGSNVKLQGMIKEGETQKSYVVTEGLENVTENKNVEVKAVPYEPGWTQIPGPNNDKTDYFKEFAGRANFWSYGDRVTNNFFNDYNENGIPDVGEVDQVNGNETFHGLKKWNLGELSDAGKPPILQGVKISKNILNYQNIKQIIEPEILADPQLAHLQILEEDNLTSGQEGWVVILPSPEGTGAVTALYDELDHTGKYIGGDGYLEKAIVYLNTTAPDIVIHENIWHAIRGNVGHSNSITKLELPNLPSMGRYSSPYPLTEGGYKSTPADKKLNGIIKTYPGMRSLNSILGDNWQN